MDWGGALHFAWTTLVSGALASSAVLAALFTKAGERLLTYGFDRRLTDFKHTHNREIETLRSELGRLSDRGVRSNEREYNATVAAWEGFVEAFDATQRCLTSYLSYPDFNKMSSEELGEFLDASSLSESQKKDLLKEADKNTAYSQMMKWQFVFEAKNTIYAARTIIRKQAIFITEDLDRKISKVLDLCSEAVIEREGGLLHGVRVVGIVSSQAFLTKRDTLYAEVLAMVRARLFNT